ncbi:hypothetical protein OGH69_04060 [Flavobacterium sp. MFBS3-15]|uniref:hypothetical protein n=1 Tax=Flavobacterium sp. MFBS3-15 TaxID=2989816 RepID=UPI0022356EA0|nr:hypothetical protein [Flavobacterium sp. MFBS3-15]MCW4468130.1 hypothetical protein [Flavobacterium sp. MFBS3-15]
MGTTAREWAKSYFSRLETAVEQLKNHDLVSRVNFIKYPGATDGQIGEAEAKIYSEQLENVEYKDSEAPDGPFAFNEYIKEFYKISNGLHVSWHSVIFPETEAMDPGGKFPIAWPDDDYKEGWISVLPIGGLASSMGFSFGGDPKETSLGESEESYGALFNYFDGFNYYYDACIALRNGNPSIKFGDDHSASYDEPHACDFVIYMEYALSTFFSVRDRSGELHFADTAVHEKLEAMTETLDYSELVALLANNEHTDIDSVIAFSYEEIGNQYADEEYRKELPESISQRITTLIGE